MKYKEWLRIWIENYIKPSAKANTVTCYETMIENHIVPYLGELALSEVTPMAVQMMVTKLMSRGNEKTGKGLSASTVNLLITLVQSSLEVAYSMGLVTEFSADKIKRPKIKEKPMTCFTLDEQKKIEAYIRSLQKPRLVGILLCLYTGLRIGELMALEWNDIDFEKREMHINKSCTDGKNANGKFCRLVDTPKTETSIRTIPLPKQLIPILKDAKRKNGSRYVVGDRDTVIAIRSYQRTFELLLKRLNIPHRGFHSLRHTFATRALECGMDVKTLSEILGHKSPAITLARYAHSLMDHKREMMNRVGKLL